MFVITLKKKEKHALKWKLIIIFNGIIKVFYFNLLYDICNFYVPMTNAINIYEPKKKGKKTFITKIICTHLDNCHFITKKNA